MRRVTLLVSVEFQLPGRSLQIAGGGEITITPFDNGREVRTHI